MSESLPMIGTNTVEPSRYEVCGQASKSSRPKSPTACGAATDQMVMSSAARNSETITLSMMITLRRVGSVNPGGTSPSIPGGPPPGGVPGGPPGDIAPFGALGAGPGRRSIYITSGSGGQGDSSPCRSPSRMTISNAAPMRCNSSTEKLPNSRRIIWWWRRASISSVTSRPRSVR